MAVIGLPDIREIAGCALSAREHQAAHAHEMLLILFRREREKNV